MEEKQMNGLNLENILAKAPSEEVRNDMLVDAVERGLADNPEYFDRAVQILEQEKKYAALASLYSNKERASYDADKALLYYKKAIVSYGFKKDAEKRIGTGAVLREIGRKTLKGCKETLKFIGNGFILPTIIRRNDYQYDDPLPYLFMGLIGGIISFFSPLLLRHNSRNNMDVYDFIPLIAFGASNAVSGLYEWYRYEKNKLQEKAGKSGLEEKVEESHEKVSQDLAPALTIEEAPDNPLPTAGRQKLTE